MLNIYDVNIQDVMASYDKIINKHINIIKIKERKEKLNILNEI